MIEAGVVEYLRGKSGVVDIIADRIYPDLAPEGAGFPRLTYTLVSDVGSHTLTAAAGYSVARIQFDCWGVYGADGYKNVKELAEELRLALDGYRGSMGDFFVQGCFVEDRRDLSELPDYARTSVDVMFWYDQSVPTF